LSLPREIVNSPFLRRVRFLFSPACFKAAAFKAYE
jgi:hypothetical protein